MKFTLVLVSLSLLQACSHTVFRKPTSVSELHKGEKKVVLIVLDGVRRKDVYYPKFESPFVRLNQRIVNGEILAFGNPKEEERMVISNRHGMSLPGYQGILTGEDPSETCKGNAVELCPKQVHPTIFDMAIRAALPANRLVSVASWQAIDRAISVNETIPFYHNAGFTMTGTEIDHECRVDPPEWDDSRKDVYTKELADKLWVEKNPRLMFVQLVDSDEWGHKNKFRRYQESLRDHDEWIDKWIAETKADDDTFFIITTDHGRGEGKNLFDIFRGHGPKVKSSYHSWAMIYVPEKYREQYKKQKRAQYEQKDIAVTIKQILKIKMEEGEEERSLLER